MNIVTKYPVLVDPSRTNINDYKLNEPSQELPGAVQKVAVGDFVIKGTNPVFDNDREVTNNEFMYLKPIDDGGQTLTPMDEYMYSGRNYSDGKYDFGEFVTWGDVFENAIGPGQDPRKLPKIGSEKHSNLPGDLLSNPWSKPNPVKTGLPTGTYTTPAKITTSQYMAAVQDIPGGPTAQEQIDKAKTEGKFWNAIKGGWDKFKTTENGQIIVQSGMAYLLNKLGATTGSTDTTTPPAPPATDDKKPLSKTTKTILIVGGIAVLGLIIYSVVKKK